MTKQLCDNACRNTEVNFGRGIGILQCYDNQQEYKIVIQYTEFLDEDITYLCKECLKELKKSARRNNYKLKIVKI